MYAAHATDVTANPSRDPRRAASSTSFTSALRDGLADLAYSYDGAFRPTAAMSLADQASYGLRSPVQSPDRTTESSPTGVCLTSYPIREVTCVGTKAQKIELPAAREAIARSEKRQASPGENVRREAKPRRASASDPKPHVRPGSATRHLGARIRAKIGSSKVDVIVHGGGRLANVRPWTR